MFLVLVILLCLKRKSKILEYTLVFVFGLMGLKFDLSMRGHMFIPDFPRAYIFYTCDDYTRVEENLWFTVLNVGLRMKRTLNIV